MDPEYHDQTWSQTMFDPTKCKQFTALSNNLILLNPISMS